MNYSYSSSIIKLTRLLVLCVTSGCPQLLGTLVASITFLYTFYVNIICAVKF